ncbi:MAG: EAL domain-containing protein [Burkholderiales bacterium]|nr:EAL domain-containing protein [Burkholderiales bacterium]
MTVEAMHDLGAGLPEECARCAVGESVLRRTPDIVVRYDLALCRTYANRAFEYHSGLRPLQYLGRRPSEASNLSAAQARELEALLADVGRDGIPRSRDVRWTGVNGQPRWFCLLVSLDRHPHGAPSGLLMIASDITARRRAEQELREREQAFRALVEQSPDMIGRHDHGGRLIYANPALQRLLDATAGRGGRATDDFVAEPQAYRERVQAVFSTAQEHDAQMRHVREDGRPGWLEVRLCPECDEHGEVVSVFVVARDITDAVEQRERAHALVRTDALTRLHNRQALYEHGPALLSEAQRHARRVGLIVLDLDRFKDVNDSLGHPAGDRLLCQVAERLAECTRAYDLLVRLGGDEFAIVTTNLDSPWCMVAIAEKIERALATPMPLGGTSVVVQASMGLAVFPEDGTELEDLLAHADSAMYHAKRGGARRFEFYSAEHSAGARDRLAMEQALRQAQHGEGLVLMYQPVVCLGSGAIIGAEALLRWQHPQLGLLAPDRFIGLAEDTGLIVPIGRWVIEQVMAMARAANAGRARPLSFSFNVSTRQLLRDELPQAVSAALARTGCDPRWLVMEVTESLLLENGPHVQAALAALRRMGLRIAIDDFGTGYSALNYLSRFDVQGLKIDREFVRDIEGNPRQAALVKAFLAIADALQMTVVAEGVENAAQADILRAHGCGMAQGYLFHRPLAPAAFDAAVAASDAAQHATRA